MAQSSVGSDLVKNLTQDITGPAKKVTDVINSIIPDSWVGGIKKAATSVAPKPDTCK